MMDQVEKGTVSITAVPDSSKMLYSSLLLASLLLSTMALTMSTLVCMRISFPDKERVNHSGGMSQTTAHPGGTTPMDALIVSHGEHVELGRSIQTEICNSTVNSTILPSAHIICSLRNSRDPVSIPAPARQVILSKNWACNKDQIPRQAGGFVQGGMSYNKDTGYLLLPVDGIYFIYSQVMFSAKNASNGQTIMMGHRTVVCRPDSSSCGPTTALLETMSYPAIATDKSTLDSYYHGGLLNAVAGTQIALAGWYDNNLQNGNLLIDTHWSHSYMGAFLVQSLDNYSL